MPLNPEATFDCLFIASRLQAEGGTFTVPELHLFAYLGCLLWLYRRRAVADWGYSFVGTELGAPFSLDIDGSAKALFDRGYFLRVQDRVRMSEDSDQPLLDFGRLEINRDRSECLSAACASAVALPIGIVGTALAQEPDLRRARATPMSRPLLEDLARSRLYAHFDALRDALSQEGDDLRLRAVVWLAALYRSSELAA